MSAIHKVYRNIDFENNSTKYRVQVIFEDGAPTSIVLFEYLPKVVLERNTP